MSRAPGWETPGRSIDRWGSPGRWAIALAIAAGSVVLYWPIRGHEWLMWDDFIYITQNPHIAQGLSVDSIRWATTSFYQANWFPGTWLSWMLEFELHGFDAGAFLTTNLILHAANSVLLFAALQRLTKSTVRSAFVAAVFAVHPPPRRIGRVGICAKGRPERGVLDARTVAPCTRRSHSTQAPWHRDLFPTRFQLQTDFGHPSLRVATAR